MKYADLSIKTYLKRLASKSPVPGGGSAAAGFTSAFESAKLNVDINIKSIKDEKFVDLARKKLKKWHRF